jgi:5-formyltetrahydrofolate cyclo-ligase
MSGSVEESAKKNLRARMLALRRDWPEAELRALSVSAQKRLLLQEIWKKAGSVALYMPIRGEVDTALLLEGAWREGKAVFLPRVEEADGLQAGKSGKMRFVFCRSPADLRKGAYGIPEPLPDTEPLSGFFPRPPDLFVVPGVAFDRQGGRLGFGGGYYDRFLASCLSEKSPGGMRFSSFFVGLAYSFQLREEKLPLEAWDQPVQALCTDAEFLFVQERIASPGAWSRLATALRAEAAVRPRPILGVQGRSPCWGSLRGLSPTQE